VAEVIYAIGKNPVYELPPYRNVMYPNPVAERLVIQIVNVSLEDQVSIKITDMNGTVIQQLNVPLKREIIETVWIELGDLSNGTYLIKSQLKDHYEIERINVLH
jgi:hypothetical protein